jgi:APA family basic amino acid/polyamine antiporter
LSTLVRSIGVRGLTAAVFNITVGAGIFAMPALVAQSLGTSAVYAYVACASAMLCIVLSFAVAASRVPRAGGTYAYAEAAFGPFVGFLGGTVVWLSDVLASAAVVAGLSAAIGAYAPVLDTPPARAVILMAVLGGLSWVNMRGVKQGTRVLEVLTIAKLAPLLLLVGAALLTRGGAMWSIGPLPDVGTIGRATLVLIFAFSGAETTMALTGEVTQPSRTIPRALILALALITGLYVTVHLAAAVALGAALPQTPDAPLAEAAAILIGPQGRAVLLAGTVISMFGYVSALVMSTPRLVFAVAQRGLLPAWLGRVHPRWHTPAAAIAAQSLLIFVVASSGTFGALASFASVAVVSVYLLACASALQLQRSRTQLDVSAHDVQPPFHVPAAVPIAGALICVALLAQSTRHEFAVVAGVLAVASVWYLARTRGRTLP